MAKSARLPSEYQEVKYIKTHTSGKYDGNSPKSFICTNIPNDTISKVIVKYGVISFPGLRKSMILASHANGNTTALEPYITVDGTSSGGLTLSPTISSPYDGKTEVYTVTYPANASYNLRIGGWTDVAWTAEGAYYSVDVYDTNNGLLAQFAPCYRKSDNKAGMYEIIGGAFYPSNGTMDFIAGANV